MTKDTLSSRCANYFKQSRAVLMNVRFSLLTLSWVFLISCPLDVSSRLVRIPHFWSALSPPHLNCSYDFVKTTLLKHPIPIVQYKFHDSLPLHLVSSLLAGMFATSTSSLQSSCTGLIYPSSAICSPADVMRSRLMASVSLDIISTLTSTADQYISQVCIHHSPMS